MDMGSKINIAETERLILRRYKEEDLQDLFEYLSDKEVVEYEPYKPLTLNETKENLEWRIGTDEMIAVELKDSHKMIGNVYMGKREFEALGFQREAHLRKNVYFWKDENDNAIWKDTYIYAKLVSDGDSL